MTPKQLQCADIDEFSKYLRCFAAAGRLDTAFHFFQERLWDTVLFLSAEGYLLECNSEVQDLLTVGSELFGYDGESFLEELDGED